MYLYVEPEGETFVVSKPKLIIWLVVNGKHFFFMSIMTGKQVKTTTFFVAFRK